MRYTKDAFTRTLPLTPGDLVVENVGGVIRFWRVDLDGKKVNKIARSFVFMGARVVVSIDGKPMDVHGPAFTVAKIFAKGNAAAQADLIRATFRSVGDVHFFYSGHGPSGKMWCFSSTSHYTA